MKRLLLAFVLATPLVFAATCVDYDGGINYSVQGLCEDPYKERADYCLDEERVAEYYCSGKDTGYCWATSYACKSVEGSTGECIDGACTMIEEETDEATPPLTATQMPGYYDIGVNRQVIKGEGTNPEAQKPIEDFPFWLVLTGVAVSLLVAYRLSQDRMHEKKKKKKVAGRKTK